MGAPAALGEPAAQRARAHWRRAVCVLPCACGRWRLPGHRRDQHEPKPGGRQRRARGRRGGRGGGEGGGRGGRPRGRQGGRQPALHPREVQPADRERADGAEHHGRHRVRRGAAAVSDQLARSHLHASGLHPPLRRGPAAVPPRPARRGALRPRVAAAPATLARPAHAAAGGVLLSPAHGGPLAGRRRRAGRCRVAPAKLGVDPQAGEAGPSGQHRQPHHRVTPSPMLSPPAASLRCGKRPRNRRKVAEKDGRPALTLIMSSDSRGGTAAPSSKCHPLGAGCGEHRGAVVDIIPRLHMSMPL
mmetsp:Transcript_20850/g.53440  ORF Transcript_20850/g.53440 Transcript_20850/m.53440 type:complete len:302 (+) Transcript_20850:926-1831(+)